jgi:hypothetical protein
MIHAVLTRAEHGWSGREPVETRPDRPQWLAAQPELVEISIRAMSYGTSP